MVDRTNFNYGTGWPSNQRKPQIYFEAKALADRLREIAQDTAEISWTIDMAIREVRLAETSDEQETAIDRLYEVVAVLRGEGGFEP
jgi:hypothetical protein